MKQSRRCPKCTSTKIGYLESAVDRGGEYGTDNYAAVIGESRDRDWVGLLEALVCTECGYYETYVKNPARVAFTEIKGFRWVNAQPPPGAPYR